MRLTLSAHGYFGDILHDSVSVELVIINRISNTSRSDSLVIFTNVPVASCEFRASRDLEVIRGRVSNFRDRNSGACWWSFGAGMFSACVECMPKAKGRAKVDRNVVIIGAATWW